MIRLAILTGCRICADKLDAKELKVMRKRADKARGFIEVIEQKGWVYVCRARRTTLAHNEIRAMTSDHAIATSHEIWEIVENPDYETIVSYGTYAMVEEM